MKKCSKCEIDFPDHLINDMAIGPPLRYIACCPPCALEIEFEVHGVRRKNFSPGSRAQEMLVEARAFLDSPQHKQRGDRGV